MTDRTISTNWGDVTGDLKTLHTSHEGTLVNVHGYRVDDSFFMDEAGFYELRANRFYLALSTEQFLEVDGGFVGGGLH